MIHIARLLMFAGFLTSLTPIPSHAAVPNSPSWPQSSLELLVDNDYAAFLGDADNANQLLVQNNVAWPTQVTNATSIDIVGSDTQTYVYVVAMGGGGTEDFGGRLNGQDITGIPGAQFASVPSKSSTFGSGTRTHNYLEIRSSITGYSSADAASGVQQVSLTQLRSALTGASWSSAVATGSGNGIPPNYKTSGVACGSNGGGVATGRCWDTPSDQAVVFRYPISSLGTPVTPGNRQVQINWSAPVGGANTNNYVVQYKRSSEPDIAYSTFSTPNVGITRETVTALTNGVSYSFRVAAQNADGISAYTIARQATPIGPPPSPTSLSATVETSTVIISFTSPVSDGGSPITNYEFSLDDGQTWSTPGSPVTSSPLTISGLVPGSNYVVRLRALNSYGQGESSSAVNLTTKEDQVINFPALPDRSLDSSPFSLTGSSSSGLTLSYQSGTPSVCSVSGSFVELISTGTCTINANQAGDSSFAAANRVSRTFSVTTGTPTITLTGNQNLSFGVPTLLSATTNTAGVIEFRVNGRAIKNCKARPTTVTLPYVSTCLYKPDTRRLVVFQIRLTPTNSGFYSTTLTTGKAQVTSPRRVR